MDAEQHDYERMRQFAGETVTPGGIVLLGSSHLEWYDTKRFLPGRNIVNRGIVSDRLGIGPRGILRRLDLSVFRCAPGFILFENGANDLGELWRNGEPPMDAIIDAYERVLMALRERLPRVPLLVVNVLPTTGPYAGLNPFVRQLNPHVARLADAYGCAHLDFHNVVVSDAGELRRDLTEDGLHLNDAGYALFTERLQPYLPALD